MSIPRQADAELDVPKVQHPTIPYDKDEAAAYLFLLPHSASLT